MTSDKKQVIRKRIKILRFLIVLVLLIEAATVIALLLRSNAGDHEDSGSPVTSETVVPSELAPVGKNEDDRGKQVVDSASREVTEAQVIRSDAPTGHGYPALVLVIDDMGNQWNTPFVQGVLNMDIPLTLAILPGHWAGRRVAEKAHETNKDVLIHFPMQPMGENKAVEKKMLREGMTREQISELCETFAEEVPFAVGINNHQGSAATQSAGLMRDFVALCRSRGWLILDSLTHPKSLLAREAEKQGVDALKRDYFLDHYHVADSIRKTLYKAVHYSRERERAVVIIGHPLEVTWNVLQDEIPKLKGNGVRWLTVSQAVREMKQKDPR